MPSATWKGFSRVPPEPSAERRRVLKASDALGASLQRIEGQRASKLHREELRAFPAFYREAVAELAEARARGLRGQRVSELEGLILRAHGVLYAPEPTHLGKAFLDVLLAFPPAARRHARAALLATAVMAVGGLWGFFQVHGDPASASVFLSGSLQTNAESFQKGFAPRTGDPVYGAFYFTNNARVAFLAYALGATFGVGTLMVLLFNGAILGATVAIVAAHGSFEALLSYVIPHAGVELTAIIFSAAAGLHIGAALLSPGWRRRRDALAVAARESLSLVLGSAALLIVAGIVEGWISPMPLGLGTKAAIGGGLDFLLLVYLLTSRRPADP